MIIYFAAPLFSQAEKRYNADFRDVLEREGFTVILPQDFDIGEDAKALYKQCLESIEKSDIVVAILDGADHDSGTSLEIGYALALKKKIIGVRSDFRTSSDMNNGCNLMIFHACDKVLFASMEFSAEYIKRCFGG